MKRPLILPVLFYCLGVVLATVVRLDFWVLILVASTVIVFAVCFARRQRLIFFAILFSALLLGCLNLQNSQRLPNIHICNFIAQHNNPIFEVQGFVACPPERQGNRQWFILRARQVRAGNLGYKCVGDVLVRVSFMPAFDYGEGLKITGNLKHLSGFGRSKGYRDYLARQGIFLVMSVNRQGQITRLGTFSGNLVMKSALGLRGRLEEIIRAHLPQASAGILSAMVLGQKNNIPWLVNEAMVKSGTVHILVVSGFNVGIVIFMVNLLFKILRIRRRVRIILIAAFVAAYCLVTGASNPVLRATTMGLVFLFAYFFRRQADIYNSLAAACLLILWINPRQIFDVGFQLSFASVLSIVYFFPRLGSLAKLEKLDNRFFKFTAESCLVSLAAWLGTVFIIALNFKILSLITVPANIAIVPLAALITLCGFTLVISGLICPALAALCSYPVALLITLLLRVNAILLKVPFAYIYFDKGIRQW